MSPVFIRTLVPLVLVALSAACGGAPGNPVEPSPPATGGATIAGVVTGPAGLSVSVAGTLVAATVDASSHFTLAGVPPGDRELVFAGPGVDARLPVAGVKEGEQIALQVTVAGTSAMLSGEQRSNGEKVELEGRIAAINPSGSTTPTLVVDAMRVSVPEGTDIRHGTTPIDFADLEVGYRVHVRGTMSASASDLLVADLVILQNDNANVPVNITGEVGAIEAGCPLIRFVVDGWTIETDSETDFKEGTCNDIKVGTEVHVFGAVLSSGRVLAAWITVEADDPPEPPADPNQKVELEGRIAAINPNGSTRTLLVDSTRVSVPATADIRHGDTTILFTDLKVGDRVHVRGTRSTDATGPLLVADLVILQNDNANVPVNIKGAVSTVTTLACPVAEFEVDGWTIETRLGTDFRKAACETIKVGTQVHVFGTVQTSTSDPLKRVVLATWVQVGS